MQASGVGGMQLTSEEFLAAQLHFEVVKIFQSKYPKFLITRGTLCTENALG